MDVRATASSSCADTALRLARGVPSRFARPRLALPALPSVLCFPRVSNRFGFNRFVSRPAFTRCSGASKFP
eukprot:6265896-Pyramimonas_sp.AAC.1